MRNRKAALVVRRRFVLALLAGWCSLAHAAAPAGRYTVGTGTVQDNKTKLTWQQVVPSGTYTWAAAKSYCVGLGATLGGTWRLPTVRELVSIVDHSRSQPAIEQTAFPNTPNEGFWSSTPYIGISNYAFNVSFYTGDSLAADATTPLRVRCVR